MGLRDIEAGAPVRPDTLFPICSVTGSFTATGLALLVDEGKLDWNTPVRETLPEFRLRDLVATEPAAWFENGTAQFATGVENHIESVVVPLEPAGRADRLPASAGTRDGDPRLSGAADRNLPLRHHRVSHRGR
jgi:Beta-lactamase